jgi:hypothetical protein
MSVQLANLQHTNNERNTNVQEKIVRETTGLKTLSNKVFI